MVPAIAGLKDAGRCPYEKARKAVPRRVRGSNF